MNAGERENGDWVQLDEHGYLYVVYVKDNIGEYYQLGANNKYEDVSDTVYISKEEAYKLMAFIKNEG